MASNNNTDAITGLKKVYDESSNRLRVDPGTLSVSLDHANDSVKVGDGTDFLAINTDGSINVTISNGTPSNETESLNYNEISSIAAATETNIITYIVPLSTTFYLHKILTSGTNLATYKVKINGTTKVKGRSWWTDFDKTFDFGNGERHGMLYPAGTTITVTVEHNSLSLGDFNSTILGLEAI